MKRQQISKLARTMAVIAAVVGSVFALAPAASATDGIADGLRPSMFAYPTTGLSEGDKVSVVLDGFHPNELVGVSECATPVGWAEVCDFEHGVNFYTNDGGIAYGDWFARRKWTGTDPLTGKVLGKVDCKVTSCRIGSASPVNHEGASTPISFK
jgi:hypothetical protein